MEKIYQSRYLELPSQLVEAAKKANASTSELHSLLSRILYIDELGQKMIEWGGFDDVYDSDEAFVDRVELHAGLCFALGNNGSYSWWIAHSSWASDIGISNDSAVDALVEKAIKNSEEKNFSSEEKFRSVISNFGETICSLVDIFFASRAAKQAVGCLIAMNLVVSLVLSSIIRKRILLLQSA